MNKALRRVRTRGRGRQKGLIKKSRAGMDEYIYIYIYLRVIVTGHRPPVLISQQEGGGGRHNRKKEKKKKGPDTYLYPAG